MNSVTIHTGGKKIPKKKQKVKPNSDITDAALIKLVRKAGVVMVSGDVNDELRDIIQSRFENILKTVVTLMEYNKKKIFSEKILEQTFDHLNIKMYGSGYEDLKRCETDKSKPKNVIKTIRFLQEQSDCVYFSKSGFKRYVTTTLGYVKSDIKVSKAASSMLQVFIENTTIDLCQNANVLAIHAGRKTLFIDDLRLVITLVKDPLDFIGH